MSYYEKNDIDEPVTVNWGCITVLAVGAVIALIVYLILSGAREIVEVMG